MTGEARASALHRADLAILAALAVLAAWLRLRGLAFGLPAVYNPDEVAIMSRALSFATGGPNPHNFLYPTLYFYGLFAWEGAYFLVARLAGSLPSLAAFKASFFTDPTGIYLAGRALTVCCGVATVVATWRLGRDVGGRPAGFAAALFMAAAPFAVQDSHYVKHDVPTTLAITAAMLAILRLSDAAPSARRGWLWLAGGLAGIATSMHYYAVFLGVPLAIAVVLAWREARWSVRAARVAASAGVAAAAFVLGSPFLLAEPLTAWRDIRANRRIVMDRAVEATHAFGSAGAYLTMLWNDAMGWPVCLLAIAGAVVLVRRAPLRALLFASFPVVFFLFISNTVAATRYLNPVLPFLAVLAAIGAVTGTSIVRRGRPGTIDAAVIAAAAAVPGLVMSWHLGTFFRQTDTRSEALAWIESHVSAGTAVLVQPYSVPLRQSRAGLVEALTLHLGDPARASIKFRTELGLEDWPDPAYRVLYLGSGGLDVDKIYVDYAGLGGAAGLATLSGLGVRYVVLKRYNVESPALAPLIEALGHDARLAARFSPYRERGDSRTVEPFLHNTDARLDAALERPGPVIEIWQLS